MKQENSLSKRLLIPDKAGFGIIEAILGITIATILFVTLTSLTIKTMKISQANTDGLKAINYLRELIEIAKDLEQSNWEELKVSGGPWYPIVSSSGEENNWLFVSGEESLENGTYTRWLEVEKVYRDNLTFPNEILPSPGVLDLNTKKVIAKIKWSNGLGSQEMILEAYLYKYD